MATKTLEIFDNKKLYSFEDPELRSSENQESINFALIKDDNALNAASPIQNNTIQDLDSEFLKEYEDAISDRDKKIAELMHEIEKLKQTNAINFQNPNSSINDFNNFNNNSCNFQKDDRKKIKNNFDLLAKLLKDIENLHATRDISEETPKFQFFSNNNTELSEKFTIFYEALKEFEKEVFEIIERRDYNNNNNNENMRINFNNANIENNNEMLNLKEDKKQMEDIIDQLKKDNIEIKYALQNSIQQIQDLEMENIGLNDQITTLNRQIESFKKIQAEFNDRENKSKELITRLQKENQENCEKSIKNLKEKESSQKIIEQKQKEIDILLQNKQKSLQLELKVQELSSEIKQKTQISHSLIQKNKTTREKLQKFKKFAYKLTNEMIIPFKLTLQTLAKQTRSFQNFCLEDLKENLRLIIQRFSNEKKAIEFDFTDKLNEKTKYFEKKVSKQKNHIKALKNELEIAQEFKYQPVEETLNTMHSKFLTELEDRKSFYPKDFMKDTNFFKKTFLSSDKSIQTTDLQEKKLNESLHKFEEQSLYMNKEIALINNNMSSLEQDYKAFLNIYSKNLKERDSLGYNDEKLLANIQRIYEKIEENSKKDERINSLIEKLSEKSFRNDDFRLNRTELLGKESLSFEVQRFENENLSLVRELEKIKRKLDNKEKEIQEKDEIIEKLEKDKRNLASECKDLQLNLQLKNAQYQAIVNQKKSSYIQNIQTEPTPIRSFSTLALNESYSITKKKSLFNLATPLSEKQINNTSAFAKKETLNSIKKIFQSKKI